MPVLSAGDIAEFRALVQDLALHDTYALLRATSTPDGEGGGTDAESTVESGPCDLTAGLTRPDERELASRVQAVTPYLITLPYASSATASDRLAISGRTFEVRGVLKDGFLGTDVRAICEEVG